MPTSARKRKKFDAARAGQAVAYPGIDPRSWVALGRIENDPDAVRWLPRSGWVADVTLQGGAVDGQEETPCRVAAQMRGSENGEFLPPAPDCEVAVVIPSGNTEEAPAIVGYFSNGGGCEPPTTVNGLPINPDVPTSVPMTTVSPFDTEIKVSPYNRQEEYAQSWTLQAQIVMLQSLGLLTLQAPQLVISPPVPGPGQPPPPSDIKLGGNATESALLGETTNANMNSMLQAMLNLGNSLSVLTGPLAPLQAIGVALVTEVNAIIPQIPNQLSQSVKVE